MTEISASEAIVVHPSDSQTYALDFTPILHGRTISAVGSVVADSGFTVGSAVVNSDAFIHDKTGETVSASHAIQFSGSSGVAGTDYNVTVTATLSDGSTVARVMTFEVRST